MLAMILKLGISVLVRSWISILKIILDFCPSFSFWWLNMGIVNKAVSIAKRNIPADIILLTAEGASALC